MVSVALTALACVPSCARIHHRQPDAGPPTVDVAVDAGFAARIDGGRDAGFDAGRDGGHCVSGRAALPPGHVDVVFVIDSSTSMGWVPEDGGDGLTRWEALRIALRDAFADFDPRARSAALFFPTSGRCYVEQRLDVPLETDNVASIIEAFDGRELAGRSPIDHGIARAGLALLEEAPFGPNRYLILITDGDETCSGLGRTPAYPTLSVLRSRYFIETRYVRVDRRERDPAGPGFRGLDELRGILREIADTLGRCVFDVPLERSADARVEVRVGGEPVRRGWDGWEWSGTDAQSLSLHGDACRARLRSNAPVELTFACE